jgi:hypothetical protein
MAGRNRPNDQIETKVRDLLASTRAEADRYSSAAYRDESGAPTTGLGMRLDAIEQALIQLAQEFDRRDSPR